MPAAAPTPSPPLPEQPTTTHRRCENCGAPLVGEHCHACGQPTKGLVRHFSSVLGDFADTVFNIDSRVLRTLGPLMFRPGFLSLEYFTGRRVRYVTPTRLFLFLSLLAFFVIQASIEVNGGDERPTAASNRAIDAATTPEQVRAISARTLQELDAARKDANDVPGAMVGIDLARDAVRSQAEDRIAWLEQVEAAKAAGTPPPPPPDSRKGAFNFPINGKSFDPVTNPINFAWLPAAVNASLTRRLGHARDVLEAEGGEKPLLEAMFNVLPQTLIVLMPLFALMLKVAYWLKRRLYMEHLIVALHSHSFIALALILVLAFSWLEDWLAPTAGFAHSVLVFVRTLLLIWIPVYLLLMQKRVYAQGWPMTLLKFGVLGICYSVLLSFGLVAAMLIGLLTL